MVILEICKLLGIDHKVPVELAIWQSHLSIAIYLEVLGAKPHHPNSWGCTTAHWLGKLPIKDVELVRKTCDWLFIQCKVESIIHRIIMDKRLYINAAYVENLTSCS